MSQETMSENENETEQAEPEVTEAEVVEASVPETEPIEAGRNGRKLRTGVVVSDKGDKTVTVMVERRFAHPLYGKGMKRSTRLHAHDENNDCRIGDKVRIMETRPLSKMKRWRVVEIQDRRV